MTSPFPPPVAGGPLLRPWRGSSRAAAEAGEGQSGIWRLRGSRMRTRQDLMEEWSGAAGFPPHFGGTWDALRDALSDLPEGGTFLVLDADQLLQEASPEEARLLWTVLKAVQEDLRPRPFQLLLQAEGQAYDMLVEGLRALGLDQPDRAR